jgi:hypothetical protein
MRSRLISEVGRTRVKIRYGMCVKFYINCLWLLLNVGKRQAMKEVMFLEGRLSAILAGTLALMTIITSSSEGDAYSRHMIGVTNRGEIIRNQS